MTVRLNPVLGTRHLGIVVQDLGAAQHFYGDLLGLTVQGGVPVRETGGYIGRVTGVPGADVEWVKLRAADASVVELLHYRGGVVGPSHLALTVRSLARLYPRLLAAGVVCVSPPQRSPDGAVRVLYCRDPDGTTVELVEDRPRR